MGRGRSVIVGHPPRRGRPGGFGFRVTGADLASAARVRGRRAGDGDTGAGAATQSQAGRRKSQTENR